MNLVAVEQLSIEGEDCERCEGEIAPGVTYVAFCPYGLDDAAVNCCPACFERLLASLMASGS